MITVGFDTSPLLSGHKTRGIGSYTTHLLGEFKKIQDIKIIEFTDINKLKGVDLIHYPYFDLFFRTFPKQTKFPCVVTIHDVIPLIFPQHYPPGLKGRFNLTIQKRALQRVNAIITPSVASKKDIMKYLQ